MARPRLGQEKRRPHRVAFLVTEEVRAGLEVVAQQTGQSMSDVANEALEAYLAVALRAKRKAKKEIP